MTLPRPGQVLAVLWDDSDSDQPWRGTADDAGVGHHLVWSVGQLVERRRDAWVLALSTGRPRAHLDRIVSDRDRCRIPRGCIVTWHAVNWQPELPI